MIKPQNTENEVARSLIEELEHLSKEEWEMLDKMNQINDY